MARTFPEAAAHAEGLKLKEKATYAEQGQIYGLYKVGKGEDFAKVEKPSRANLWARGKYNSWEAIINEGITKEDAQTKYVALIEQLESKYTE